MIMLTNMSCIVLTCTYLLMILLENVASNPLQPTTTTRRPPIAEIVEGPPMKAGRLYSQPMKSGKKYGGEVPIDYTKPVTPTGMNECRRRSKRRYLGNRERQCKSTSPMPIAWCEGVCYRSQAFLLKTFSQKTSESHSGCVPDKIVKKRVEIYCKDDNSLTVYKIKVIKTCKCTNNIMHENAVPSNSNDPSTDSQVKMFGRQLHNLQNRLKAVQ